MKASSTAMGASRERIALTERLSKSAAIEFAAFALSEKHAGPELQAFMCAWKGSIDFQSESGNHELAAGALQIEGLAAWLESIASGCQLLVNSEKPLKIPRYELSPPTQGTAGRSTAGRNGAVGNTSSDIRSILAGASSRKSKFVISAILCAVLIGLFALRHVGHLGKYVTSLNATSSRGTEITDQWPDKYMWQRIYADYRAVETEKTETSSQDWEGFRAEYLSRQPPFDDLALQNGKLQRIFAQKRASGSQSICAELAIDKFGPALDAYVTNRDQFFSLLRSSPTKASADLTALKALLSGEHDAAALMSEYVAERDAKGCKEP
jgi:hypothetical protein